MVLHRRIVVASILASFSTLAKVDPVAAASSVTYVDGAASSQNVQCTRTAPCDSISRALGQTTAGGTIVCLGVPFLAPFQVVRSVTIDCSQGPAVARGAVFGDSVDGALVSIDVPTSENLRQVRLMGLILDGAEAGGRNAPNGITIKAASAVYIDGSKIQNMFRSGILDMRTGGQTKLFVKNSDIHDNGGPGILAKAAAVGITVLDNVTLANNKYGIAAATGNNIVIKNAVISGNTTAGVEADPGAQVEVTGSVISHNNFGVQSSGTVRLSDTDIKFNNTALSGNVVSFGNNRMSGNGSPGTTTTPAAPF